MQRLEEEKLTHEQEEQHYEEEDTIQPMDDDPNTPGEQPLMGGNLPFREMGIIPTPTNRVTYVCSVIFDQL